MGPRLPLALRLLAWAPPLALMALIFALSSQPDPSPELTRALSDKVLHALAYGTLAALLYPALRTSGLAGRRAALLAAGLAALYGASDEWHQSFVPGRSSEVLDWVADVAGAAAGALCAARLSCALRPRRVRASIDVLNEDA